QAERMMKRFQKGQFSMNDLKSQLAQMVEMGGMTGIMGMMPGMGKMKAQMERAGFDDRVIRRQIALIDSMTKQERANPRILQASRKKRVAAGAGLEVSDLNRLLKMHRQMSDMMKKVGRMGKRGMMNQLGGLFGGGAMAGGMPGKAEIEAAQRQLGQMPGGLAGIGGDAGDRLPPAISGLGKKQ
ncbi:MAG: signal recognition particle protein, partial [Boseongicola sp. SB0664_bin_43]|nr:signal recognition particle protein [Boseongicola sp. SB0664_bin_43]